MSSEPAVQPDEFEALFVQSAQRVTSGDGEFTLHGLAPSTLMFSDRPERIVGHLTNSQFVDGWGHGENSFLDDPPNAVLSFLEEGDEMPEDVVVTLTSPRMAGADLTYNATVLEGELPGTTGPCSLFIDPVGRPLVPYRSWACAEGSGGGRDASDTCSQRVHPASLRLSCCRACRRAVAGTGDCAGAGFVTSECPSKGRSLVTRPDGEARTPALPLARRNRASWKYPNGTCRG
jgi:hypothetical protein